MHSNKLEWVNPRSRNEIKNLFCVSSRNVLKDNNRPAHMVGHSKLGSLDISEILKTTQGFYEKGASVTGNIEEEKNTDKKTTYDAGKVHDTMKDLIKIRKKWLQ